MKALKIYDDVPEFSEIRLLVFELGSNKIDFNLSLNTHKVKEVVSEKSIEPLPPSYQPFVGLIDLRGVPVPILDLSPYFGLDHIDISSSSSSRIIICETLGKTIGILSYGKMNIKEFKDSEIYPADKISKKDQLNFISAVIREQEGHFIYMIDLEAILDSLGLVENEASAANNLEKRLNGLNILIVEDSKIFQKKLKNILEEAGAQVYLAGNGQEGLDFLRENNQVNLIFSDIEMPILNGIEMVRAIKSQEDLKKIPVFFHSSISNPRLIEQIQAEGLGDFLVKFNKEEILSSAEKVLTALLQQNS